MSIRFTTSTWRNEINVFVILCFVVEQLNRVFLKTIVGHSSRVDDSNWAHLFDLCFNLHNV